MSLRVRVRFVGTVVAIFGWGMPAAALANAGYGVRISMSASPKVGHKFQYVVRGHSAAAGPRLATFLNTRLRCPSKFSAELATPYSGTGVYDKVLRAGSFAASYLVKPKTTGRHFICAYLYNRQTGATLARAHQRYVTTK